MSSPAAIAGIVVTAIIGTSLLIAVVILGSYIIYKYFREHPSFLRDISLRRKSHPHSRIKENIPTPSMKDASSRLDFDDAQFLNAKSNTSQDAEKQSQTITQHTMLSISDDISHSPVHTQYDDDTGYDNQAVRSKATIPHSDQQIGQHLLKATRRLSTHIPIYEPDDLKYDFSNPAFEQSDNFHCYQSAALYIQSCWRGYLVRRQLPQIRLEKLNKDRLSMPGGMKQTASLANIRFFDVRGYGYIEVEQLYGLEVVRSAVKKLKKKYGNKGRVKMKIIVTPKGIKLFDTSTNTHVATVKIEGISFCSLDPNNKKIFAFINRKRGRNFCHVFQCNEEDSQELVEVCAEAFDRVVRRYEGGGTGEKRPVSKRSDELNNDVAST
ncbi:hypothetical protein LOD99_11801 [Oopsacas minuta]|uniref:PID domain-containing protein n=1 Tax=Oopsacas minuta TaxID=111878 RepID=A0AAV7JLW5_9METZ|nr:hypothetical protein LOD99_11801 [Oopsacas minuta]